MPLIPKKTLSVCLPICISHFCELSKALQTKSRVSLFIYLGCCVSQRHVEKLASAIFTCQCDCNLNWQNKLLFTHSHWLCYVPEALGLFFQLRSPLLPSPLVLLQKHNERLAGGNVTSTAGSSWLGKAMAALIQGVNFLLGFSGKGTCPSSTSKHYQTFQSLLCRRQLGCGRFAAVFWLSTSQKELSSSTRAEQFSIKTSGKFPNQEIPDCRNVRDLSKFSEKLYIFP